MSADSVQYKTIVCTVMGGIIIEQDSAEGDDKDIIRIEMDHIDLLLQAVLKAKRQLEAAL